MARVAMMLAMTVLIGGVAGLAHAGDTAAANASGEENPPWVHGIAMHGDVKYGPDFTHFDYANPNAPKGGTVKLASVGGFDSFNPFIIKGDSAPGIGSVFDSLTEASGDEPFTRYGLVAEAMRMPEDRTWIEFRIRKEAKFHDGVQITPDDVIWTFNTLVSKGAPFYRYYYSGVAKVEKIGEDIVRFTFKDGNNKELPLIIGEMPVLPAHYWKDRPFDKTTLDPPPGSGPYRIASFEANRYVVYERDPDYWGKDLPVNRGRYNFDRMRYDVYRDGSVAVEALKAGEYDLRNENSAKNWATAYDTPELKEGLLKKEELETSNPKPMQGFAFNMRRAPFDNRQVRRALAAAFDFEWSNRTLFYGQYVRSRSYFNDSELEAKGFPTGRELEILDQFRDELPPELFTTEYNPPSTEGQYGLRRNLLKAMDILKSQGWVVDPDTLKLVNQKTGKPLAFEIMIVSPAMQRVVLPFVKNLSRMGIDATVRLVDSSQYIQRINNFDFDMVVNVWGQSLSPGNEQRDYWWSQSADHPGGRNITGLKSPVVDQLVDMIISAPDRKELVARTRALDRVLQWQYLVIPQFYGPVTRVVYWDRFGHPKKVPINGFDLTTWWVDPAKDRAVSERTGRASAKTRGDEGNSGTGAQQ